MNYRDEFKRTAGDQELLVLGALGLAGEAGEVVDLIKKHLFHKKSLDRDKLILEMGDLRWYMEALLVKINATMEEVEAVNIKKLRARYPNGFNAEDAAARKDEWKK